MSDSNQPVNEVEPEEVTYSIRHSNAMSWLLGLASFVIIIAGLKAARELIVPFLTSLFLTVICYPSLEWLTKKGFSTWFSLLVIIFTVSSVLILVVLIVGASLQDLSGNLDEYQQKLEERRAGLITWIEIQGYPEIAQKLSRPTQTRQYDATDTEESTETPETPENSDSPEKPNNVLDSDTVESIETTHNPDNETPAREETQEDSQAADSTERSEASETSETAEAMVESEASSTDEPSDEPEPKTQLQPSTQPIKIPEAEESGVDRGLQLLTSFLSDLAGLFGNILWVLLIMIFMLMEASTFPEKLADMTAHNPKRSTQADQIRTAIWQYATLKTLISMMVGGGVVILLKILDVDYALLWGLLAFFFNFIPNVGSVIAAVPGVGMALINHDIVTAIYAVIGYSLINLVFSNIVEPRVMGKGMGISALVVFLSLIFWGWVLGPVGMILSVPLTMIVKIILETSNQTRWVSILLSGDNFGTEHVPSGK